MAPAGFDVIVIGSGSRGRAVAGPRADEGLRAAMVEVGLVGGECPYWATEARSPGGEIYGAQRLETVLASLANRSGGGDRRGDRGRCQSIPVRPARDDIAILVVRASPVPHTAAAADVAHRACSVAVG